MLLAEFNHAIHASSERFDALAVGEVLGLGRQEAAQLVEEISARLERQLADRAGHVIATRAEDHFRWWLGGYRRR